MASKKTTPPPPEKRGNHSHLYIADPQPPVSKAPPQTLAGQGVREFWYRGEEESTSFISQIVGFVLAVSLVIGILAWITLLPLVGLLYFMGILN